MAAAGHPFRSHSGNIFKVNLAIAIQITSRLINAVSLCLDKPYIRNAYSKTIRAGYSSNNISPIAGLLARISSVPPRRLLRRSGFLQ